MKDPTGQLLEFNLSAADNFGGNLGMCVMRAICCTCSLLVLGTYFAGV